MGPLDTVLKRRRDEERMRAEGRLPPGQSLTLDFPVLHVGRTPVFNPDTWSLRVFGEVEREMSWTWQEFTALPTVTQTVDIHCVTRWSKFDTVWEGVRFSEFIKLFGVKPTAKYVIAHCDGGYTTNTP
ncbi:sulfite oxidase-like oxidoreductase, partial [Anaerolineae bacterium CFX9]|nr:sulfite oxidase-like oxidoreductase [Anaerolineae bacterium CFX9]